MMRFDCWAKCKTSWKRCALTLRGFEIRVPGAGWIGRDVYAFLAFTIRGDRRRNVAGGASGLLRWWALAQGSVDATFRDVASLRRCAWPARSFACPSGSRVREIVAWPASAAMVGMAAPMVAALHRGSARRSSPHHHTTCSARPVIWPPYPAARRPRGGSA